MSFTKEEREELVKAVDESSSAMLSFYNAAWAALCHATGRCGRYYQPTDDSPEARIYRLMSSAFSDT